jgi:hypothetical protein
MDYPYQKLIGWNIQWLEVDLSGNQNVSDIQMFRIWIPTVLIWLMPIFIKQQEYIT